ncbi:MAG: hypothetical protein WEB85_14055 [Dongiaceae bacterium]
MIRCTALAVLLTLFATPVAAADWEVGPAPSDYPDLSAATVIGEGGHRLFLWAKHVDGRYQVFAELHLAAGTAFAGAMPTYRIDGGDAVDTDAIRRAGEAEDALWGFVGDAVALWLLWSSDADLARRGDSLWPWLTGRELQVSFAAADGTRRTVAFSLDGSSEAILVAAGLRRE